jgi:hypothetical protein
MGNMIVELLCGVVMEGKLTEILTVVNNKYYV